MAILEVHDAQGRVERVSLSREQPALIGSSPKCDVVLSGDRVLPIHGRIRWQPGKRCFKIEASPDAQYIVVNGHKMSSSSLRPGDEVGVDDHRLFLLSDNDPVYQESAPRDDRTRVQAPPAAARVATAPNLSPEDAPRPTASRRKEHEPRTPSLLTEELDEILAEIDAPAPPAAPSRPSSTKAVPARGWGRLFYLFSPRSTRPGQEEVFSSPLVLGLVGTIAVLVLLGAALFAIIQRTNASRLYNRAVEDLSDANYRDAIRRFDEFLRTNPQDRRAGQARVNRSMANVRQYTASTGASWSLALDASRAMLEEVGGEPTFRDSRSELDEQVIKIGEALADRARASANDQVLAEAESAVALHRELAGDSSEPLLQRSRLPAKLASARAAVLKFKIRREKLAAMDVGLAEKSAAKVYAARDELVARYGDLAQDRDLVARMKQADDLIRQAVTLDPTTSPAQTTPREDPLGPPTSLVLRSADNGPLAAAIADGPIVFALADSQAYGLDATTGAPLWQVPVGLGSPFPPLAIPGGASVLVVDARHDELLRLNDRTGDLIWRQSLGEPVFDPPLILGNQVFQPTPSGKLLAIDLRTGTIQGTLALGLPLAGTPVADESGRLLYLTARKDCLFLINRDPPSCEEVVYLGHAPGSIVAAPTRIGRYLLLAENADLDEGWLRVYLLGEDGTGPVALQSARVKGWTWSAPASAGSVVWFGGDRSGLSAFALSAYGEKEPLRPIARLDPDATPSGPAYLLARSEREVWVGSSRPSAHELDSERGRINGTWGVGEFGPAVAAPQLAGQTLVFSQQNTDGPGVVLLGIEPRSGAIRWRTWLGSAWPSRCLVVGDRLDTLGPAGEPLVIPEAALREGGFVVAPVRRVGSGRQPAPGRNRLEGTGWSAVFPSTGSATILVKTPSAPEFQEVRLPAAIGAPPLVWGEELFLPGADGRAYLVDPRTGEPRAEPFVPPFDRSRPTRWLGASWLAQGAVALADDAGRVRRLELEENPRRRLAVTAEQSLDQRIIAGPVAVRDAVVLVTGENQVRALASRDLSPVGAWPLATTPAHKLQASDAGVFIADFAGGLLALGPDGRRSWSIIADNAIPLAGAPIIDGEAVLTIDRGGRLARRAAADGSLLESRDLAIAPTGGAIRVGQTLAIPNGPGSFRALISPASSTP